MWRHVCIPQWCNWRNINLVLLNSWGGIWQDLRIAGAGSALRKDFPVFLQEVISLFRVYFLPTCLPWIGCCILSLWNPFSHTKMLTHFCKVPSQTWVEPGKQDDFQSKWDSEIKYKHNFHLIIFQLQLCLVNTVKRHFHWKKYAVPPFHTS